LLRAKNSTNHWVATIHGNKSRERHRGGQLVGVDAIAILFCVAGDQSTASRAELIPSYQQACCQNIGNERPAWEDHIVSDLVGTNQLDPSIDPTPFNLPVSRLFTGVSDHSQYPFFLAHLVHE